MRNEIEVKIERLGKCTATRRVINGEFYQWKIRHGFVEVIGDYADDNYTALCNAVLALKRRFKSLFE